MMSYEYSYMVEEYLESGVYLFDLILNGFSSLFGIALYVLTALGLYTIAKRRGIRNPWLSWIPVADCWILGYISDQYRYVVKGQNKSKRKVLLTLNIVQAALTAVVLVMVIVMVVNVFTGIMNGVSEDQMLEHVLAPVGGMLLMCLPLAGVAVATTVVRYMAMYDLYTSCNPQNNVLFLILSIVFHVTEPFFIFFNRNNDGGMPPRREAPQAYIPRPVQQENWTGPEQL